MIVKRRIAEADLNASEFTAHSLRCGFATQAAANHVHLNKMMDQAWETLVVLTGYIQRVELFEDDASARMSRSRFSIFAALAACRMVTTSS
ncbi:MAG: hypothetical protein GWN55_02810, partial [Phycisphaerae bacterium]|nr:hypothetical protein [Phycisphaerae bacterium]NIV69537.1 hypothetical protein [Phycisphaerae bacterium]